VGLDAKQAAHAIALTATSIGGLSKEPAIWATDNNTGAPAWISPSFQAEKGRVFMPA